MQLYDTIFLFVFLPLFMGIYALLSERKRPWLIAAANIFFIFLGSRFGIVVFALLTVLSYFSAIAIYNYRTNEKKRFARKLIFTLNILLCVVVLLFLAKDAFFNITSLNMFAVFGGAVVPLHIISYLIDVYRGDCEAQTNLFSLTAYTGFFPSLTLGPVMKYKNFKESFSAPKISHEKIAAGIRIYILGLAEYVIIGCRLTDIWNKEILNAQAADFGLMTALLSALIYYVGFCVNVMGLVAMGQGIAVMLGFAVKPCFSRRFLTDSLYKRIKGFNSPLYSWLNDYICKPINGGSGEFSFLPFVAAVCLAALWYDFSASWLIAAFLAAGIVFLQRLAKKKSKTKHKFIASLLTSISAALLFAVCALSKLNIDSLSNLSLFAVTQSENDYLSYLFSVSAAVTLIGFVVISPLPNLIFKRMDYTWVRIAMPAFEIILVVLSAAFMING